MKVSSSVEDASPGVRVLQTRSRMDYNVLITTWSTLAIALLTLVAVFLQQSQIRKGLPAQVHSLKQSPAKLSMPGNARAAFCSAGYTGNRPDQAGYKLLRKPEVGRLIPRARQWPTGEMTSRISFAFGRKRKPQGWPEHFG